MPYVDARYWLGITLASIFGTNLGDLYAHESGFGIVPGIALLAALAALVFVVERSSERVTELFYWLVIIIIRTGATNIADYLAFRVRVPGLWLSLGLGALLALLAWRQHGLGKAATPAAAGRLGETGGSYWGAMLTAGVFGTVVGDIAQHMAGQGVAALGLALLLGMIFTIRGFSSGTLASYWIAIAVARTTGTALGDWLAENKTLSFGLMVATLISGACFIVVLLPWRGREGRRPPVRTG